MKLLKYLSALFIFILATNLYSQSNIFSYENYVNKEGDTLKYRQLISDYAPNTTYPLIIFLHGSGERGNDNKAQLKWGVKAFASSKNRSLYPSIIIAPQCPKDYWWSNLSEDYKLLSEPSKPMALLKSLIDEMIKNLPVDINRIYITGLSMGGYGTYDAMMRYPNLFAAAVPVCGGGDVSKAKTIADIPTWIFHGVNDATVDSKLSRDMLNALHEVNAQPGYTQYPEVGHFAWTSAYKDDMMLAWLFRQKKEAKTLTTYYLIRHAEKDRSNKTNKDPYLTKAGLKRAEKWANTFKNVAFDMVYSTDYNRTKATALPTAKNNNVDLTLYDPRNIDIKSFTKTTKGKTVLIVGHSNTTPFFANGLLGEKKYKMIADNNNANLYIITLKENSKDGILLMVN